MSRTFHVFEFRCLFRFRVLKIRSSSISVNYGILACKVNVSFHLPDCRMQGASDFVYRQLSMSIFALRLFISIDCNGFPLVLDGHRITLALQECCFFSNGASIMISKATVSMCRNIRNQQCIDGLSNYFRLFLLFLWARE
jgi:hypothetical protein